jgi:hypothetical protein
LKSWLTPLTYILKSWLTPLTYILKSWLTPLTYILQSWFTFAVSVNAEVQNFSPPSGYFGILKKNIKLFFSQYKENIHT